VLIDLLKECNYLSTSRMWFWDCHSEAFHYHYAYTAMVTLVHWIMFAMVFSARQRICYSAIYASARLSVCLSVRLSHGWISQRRLKLGSCNLHHRVAP